MVILKGFKNILVAAKEFLAPSYHPELHYMRGPGPACARCSKAQ